MKCSPFTTGISPCIQNDNSKFAHVRSKLMGRDTITVQGFLLECLLYEGYAHLRFGIRMYWVEKFRKIFFLGGGEVGVCVSISDLRV